VARRRTAVGGSTNRHLTAPPSIAAVRAGYEAWLARQPLAPRSRATYRQQVGWFLDWLGGEGGPGAGALSDPVARDHAARDYKANLKAGRGLRPSSVNLALAAIDHLYRHLGVGPASVRREDLPQTAPRALAPEEQKRLLRAAERAGERDRAIVVTLLYTALRLGELAALSIGDVRISARRGVAVVRRGKGDAYREVDLNAEVRAVLEAWRSERAKRFPEGEDPALFLSRTGGRLSARSIDEVVRRVGRVTGISLSAHVLRHTCLTGLVRAGNDLVLVAEIAGHRRLETTRRYSLPSAADRQAAMEGLRVDY
jgi:site-specific recombinase XerD